MRAAAVAALAAVLLAGCGGGGGYAGLTREEADAKLEQVAATAEADGTAGRELAELSSAGDEAMSRAGGADLGSVRLVAEADVSRGKTPAGKDAWVAAYGLQGVGSAAVLCVYVSDEDSSVDVRAAC